MGIYANIDCELPRDPKMIRAGFVGRALYVHLVLFCRENLTDGVIDELQLPYIVPDLPNVKKVIAKLVEVGALETIPVGWRIPPHVWKKRNPMRADVDAKRAADTKRKEDYRAAKRAEQSHQDTDNRDDMSHWDNTSRPNGTDPLVPDSQSQSRARVEPEPKKSHRESRESSSSSAKLTVVGDRSCDDDDRISQAIVIHATAASDGKTSGYAHTVRANDLAEHGARLGAYCAQHPDASPALIALDVLGVNTVQLGRLGIPDPREQAS